MLASAFITYDIFYYIVVLTILFDGVINELKTVICVY